MNKKVTSIKTKHLLVENELKDLQIFDSSLFVGQSYISNDGTQLYLIFPPIYKTIKAFSDLRDTISEWESKGLSNENIMSPYTKSKSLSPKLVWYSSRKKLKFKGSDLEEENKAAFTPKNVVIFFIVYELDTWSRDINTDFTLKNCFFGSEKITKNADSDNYKYIGYSIRFDLRSFYLSHENTTRRNIIVFGADMHSSVYIDNKRKDILILGDGPTQGLDDTTLTAEAIYSINFT